MMIRVRLRAEAIRVARERNPAPVVISNLRGGAIVRMFDVNDGSIVAEWHRRSGRLDLPNVE